MFDPTNKVDAMRVVATYLMAYIDADGLCGNGKKDRIEQEAVQVLNNANSEEKLREHADSLHALMFPIPESLLPAEPKVDWGKPIQQRLADQRVIVEGDLGLNSGKLIKQIDASGIETFYTTSMDGLFLHTGETHPMDIINSPVEPAPAEEVLEYEVAVARRCNGTNFAAIRFSGCVSVVIGSPQGGWKFENQSSAELCEWTFGDWHTHTVKG